MNKYLLFVGTLLAGMLLKGQSVSLTKGIGFYFDMNQQFIDGDYDICYEPEKMLNVSYAVGDDYTPGYYFDTSLTKFEGLLKYSQNNTFFKFKNETTIKEQTIKPDQCLGYVIGTDSFAVIENFKVEREIGGFESRKKEFAEVLDRAGNLTFYKHTKVGMNKIITTYLVKADSSENYISFPKYDIDFKSTAVTVFNEFEMLKNHIQRNWYHEDDVPVLIKLYKYKLKFDRGEKIFYNAAWDEIDCAQNAAYYAEIVSLKDSVFHLKYFNSSNQPLYEGDFTSFYPNIKRGEFIWYYPDGIIRKRVVYTNNQPKEITVNFQNGTPHFIYKPEKKSLYFEHVLNTGGQDVLDSLGNGTDTFYDSVAQRQQTYEFNQHRLANAFFIDASGRKIYQLCKKNAKLSGFNLVQGNLTARVSYSIKSVKNNSHGMLLARVIVEPTGLISDVKIIKGVDSLLDKSVLRFLAPGSFAPTWTSAKDGKTKVAQEIIVPFDFSIISFSRYRNNYNWSNPNWMMHQQWMNQMPAMRPPTVPAYHF